jgi:hypothetical protein
MAHGADKKINLEYFLFVYDFEKPFVFQGDGDVDLHF